MWFVLTYSSGYHGTSTLFVVVLDVQCITRADGAAVTIVVYQHFYMFRFFFIAVSIIGPEPLRGVILQARHPGSSIVVGEFVVPLGGAHSTLNCSSVNDTVVTWYGSPAANVTYWWRSPDDLVGTIHFV